MDRYKMLFVDEALVDTLTSRGYKLSGNELMVDIEDIAEILDIIGEEDELEFEDNED
jgi:hypothetical protein